MRTVNAGPALSFQPLKYLKRNFTIPIQEVAHLFATFFRQRREEEAEINLMWVAGYSHRKHHTAMVLLSKVALRA
jgi:hypothetical protein